jgi:hypothetical protein
MKTSVFVMANMHFDTGSCWGSCCYLKRKKLFFFFKINNYPNNYPRQSTRFAPQKYLFAESAVERGVVVGLKPQLSEHHSICLRAGRAGYVYLQVTC